MLFAVVAVACVEFVIASSYEFPARPKTYGASIEYSYEFDTSKHSRPIVHVKYGKLDIDGHTWNFDRSLRNDARLAASKDSSGENLQLFTRRHPKRWSTPWVNTLSKHRRHAPERRSSIPRSVEEPFHLEGGLHSRELVEDMISRMRKQSQEIIASHFPLFPNRFMDSISMGPPPFRFLNHNTSWKPSSPEQLVIPW